MLKIRNIVSITVFNRMDAASERLAGFRVLTSDTNFRDNARLCYTHGTTTPLEQTIVPCVAIARYIWIEVPGASKTLTLCEVQVFEQACVDNDECTTNMHNCNSLSTCTNTPGSFTCACPSRYALTT
jgi:hypothetical protein